MGGPPGVPSRRPAGGGDAGPGAPAPVLLAIALVAVGLRSYNPVGFPGLTPQEGVSLQLALALLRGGPPGTGGSVPPGAALLAALLWSLGFPDRTIAPALTLRGSPPLTGFTVWTFLFIPRMTMVALAAVDTFLLYVIGRRLLRRTLPAVAAALLFAASPLGIYTRLVLLDNLGVALVLGGFALLTSAPAAPGGLRPWYRLGSGLLFGLAILTTLAALPLLPAVLLASAPGEDRPGARRSPAGALLLWTPIALASLAFWPPAFAAGDPRGELIPGPSILPTTDGLAVAQGLLSLDPLLLALGGLGLLLVLAADRPVLVAWALGAVAYFLLAPAPADTLVIPLLPVLALTAGGLLGGVGPYRGPPKARRRRSAARLIPILLVAALLAGGAIAAAQPDLSGPQVEALRYTLAIAKPGALVIASPAYLWALDALTNRFTAATWSTPHLDRLVASHEQVYIVADDALLSAVAGNPLLGRLYQRAKPLATFGGPGGSVEIRGIVAFTVTARVLFPNGDPEVGSRLLITSAPGGQVAYEGVNLTHVVSLEEGNYTLRAFGSQGSEVGSYDLYLQADVNLAFTDGPPGSPRGLLRVAVTFGNGDPVAWAALNLTGEGFAFADRGRQSVYIAELTPGGYRLAVAGSRGQPLLLRGLTLAPGGTEEVGVVEEGLPGTARAEHDLHVTLVTAGGSGVAGALVKVMDERGTAVASGFTLFDGTYVVRLPAGRYSVAVAAAGGPLGAGPLDLDRDLYLRCLPTLCSSIP